ncbi:hypothetical protein WL76_21070 [Burkholderia ubonensis]|uniref:hypothetical protein n=1 Tax=Burkholderia ubonensis TaxID=101571 RepID=UPI00075534B9|nr:hypothetical protein [Burkholderia ubonensis]KWE50866.1 hypothetical protein WL76_21070 [Burkholderia ubonensis]
MKGTRLAALLCASAFALAGCGSDDGPTPGTTAAFDDAIRVALSKVDLSSMLIVLTADRDHTMTTAKPTLKLWGAPAVITGYRKRLKRPPFCSHETVEDRH